MSIAKAWRSHRKDAETSNITKWYDQSRSAITESSLEIVP